FAPTVVMAVLLGAFLIHGVQPGPLLIKEHPEIFWGVIASMYVGNAMLLVVMLGFGVVGLLMKRLGFEAAPLVLAFVLGRMAEESIRQSLLMSSGQFSILVTRPRSEER